MPENILFTPTDLFTGSDMQKVCILYVVFVMTDEWFVIITVIIIIIILFRLIRTIFTDFHSVCVSNLVHIVL